MTDLSSIKELEKIKKKIWETYIAISNLPQPKAYKLGGTYYGSTQLFKSVGNMLDPINGESYTSYGYCGSTNYGELWGIRIGGAYDTSLTKELRDFLYEEKEKIFAAGWAIINDYGTNFSVIGIAQR